MPEGTHTGSLSFRSLSAPVIQLIESEMHEERFSAGEFLMRQGDAATSMMVIREGVVDIHTLDDQGGRKHINKGSRGDVVGEMSLLAGGTRTASIVALSDVQVLVLPAERFHQLAHEHPAISVVLTQLVADRLGGTGPDVLGGKTFHGYRIVRRLGRGGMSVVYEAIDAESEQLVALKMMSHSLVYDESARDQFEQESQVIESLDHENIVRVFGRFAVFHTFFMVMEHCSGANLAEVIREHGPLPPEECRKILGQLAKSLIAAHDAGLVHRDIKPSNIMLMRTGRIKLMDFGLATPVLDESLSNSDSPIVGTPRYMAPEQMAGEPVGQSADYFAFGCVAYEMLTGQQLFAKTKITELLRRHAAGDLPDFSALEPWGREILKQCLAKNPAARRLDLKQIAMAAAPVHSTLLPTNISSTGGDGWEDETVIESNDS